MKTKTLASIATFITALVFISFFSCNHQKEQDAVAPNSSTVNTGTVPNKTNVETICCSANCEGGSCTASKQVCNCSCNIDGMPNCTGGGTAIGQIVEGDYTVTASADQLNYQTRLLTYFQTSPNPHSNDVYSLALDRYNLFLDNNGCIKSTQALQSYYSKTRDIQKLIVQYFSTQEIQEIQAL